MYNSESNQALSKSALRRKREREQRYQTILNAAEPLFARKGYHQTSIESIADTAEVSVGMVYFYFKNKEDILIHLLDEIGFRLRSLLGAEFEKAGASLKGFELAGKAFFEKFCVPYPDKAIILYRESVGQSDLVETHRKQIFDKLKDDVIGALFRMKENMGFRFQSEVSADVIVISILGIYERIAYQYLIWQDRSIDLNKIGQDAVTFLVGGINNLSIAESK
jgi:AcrR family transcriptional regulator